MTKEEEKAAITSQLIAIDNEFADIRAEIRGRRLPPSYYERLCGRQSSLRAQKAKLIARMAVLKAEIKAEGEQAVEAKERAKERAAKAVRRAVKCPHCSHVFLEGTADIRDELSYAYVLELCGKLLGAHHAEALGSHEIRAMIREAQRKMAIGVTVWS